MSVRMRTLMSVGDEYEEDDYRYNKCVDDND